MPALVLDERIYETSATTGTGEYTLAGAVTGFQPASVIGANNYCYYFATDDTNWEAGIGAYVSGPDRLQRTHVLASSNGDAAVNWGAGTKKIRCGPLAAFGAPRQTSKSVAGSSDVTLTALEQRVDQLVLTGALTGNINVIVDTTKWRWTVYNNTSGAYTLTVKTSAGTGIAVAQGSRMLLECDGTNVVAAAGGGITSAGFTMSTARLLGRTTASTGAVEEISVGASLTLSGGSLSGTAASDSQAGVIEIADAAEMEAASSTVLAVTPGRQHRHPSALKVWGRCGVAGDLSSPSYNVASISDSGAGQATVNIDTDFSSAIYAAMGINLETDSTNRYINIQQSPAAGGFVMNCTIGSTGGLQDPAQGYMFMAAGDQ